MQFGQNNTADEWDIAISGSIHNTETGIERFRDFPRRLLVE
jgi:hypothetical protein